MDRVSAAMLDEHRYRPADALFPLLGLKWGSRRASGCKTLEKIDVSYAATSNIDAVTRGRVWFSLAPELTDKAH